MDNLFEEPYQQYIDRTKEYSSYLMNYNPNYPPHEFIQNKIEEYL